MSLVELIPIGTLLTLLTNQVLETAVAARDVLIEQKSFKSLSKYLFDIEPVLKELQLRELNDTETVRQALRFLEEDVKMAKDLVDKYKNRSRIYLLVKCRSIVREVQDVTRNIGRSLAALPLASTEILADISDNINRLHGEMQRAVFEASHAQLRVVEKLEEGLSEQKRDQEFANIMLEEIAKAVCVPVEPSEISVELTRLRKEKEEAAERKERAEAHFLEQVIELLSHADAANNLEQIRSQYYRRMETAEKFVSAECIPPLEAFLCPIEGTVMVDPVSLCTGSTCERRAIEGWLQSGKTTDPVTNQALDEFTIRSNILLRQSIEEWRELNYCLKIRSAKLGFNDGSDSACERSFVTLQEIIKENKANKDWIAIDGLIEMIISFIGTSHSKHLKSNALLTLLAITEQHDRNKDRVVEAGGIDHIVLCLSRQIMSKPAISLLFEILHDGTKWNDSVCRKLKQHNSVVLFLVMLMKSVDRESAEKSEAILLKLCDDDDEIVSRAAAVNWYMPLIDRLCKGPESSRICMARVITKLELIDQNIQLLGEEGVIPPLVEMASGNLESKELALSALAKLSNCFENRTRIIAAAGLRPILDQMFSSNSPTIITVKCSEILEKLSSAESIKLFLDNNGLRLQLEPIVSNLVEMLQKSFLSVSIKKPALHMLLNLCRSGELHAGEMPAASMVLHLLEDPEREIREVALKLIYLLSRYKHEGISEFLIAKRMLEAFIVFLEDENQGDLQTAAVGILGFIPKSEVALTECMTNLEILPLLMNILRKGTMEAKENTLSVLSRFVDPSDIQMQRMVARLGLFPLLVTLLMSGSTTAKAQAAALLGNLSSNSSKLTMAPAKTGWWCFRRASVPVCKLHGGICDVTSTLCLIEAKALPSLVELLQEVHDHEATYETLQTLGTLIKEDAPYRGAKVLHDAGAIAPMLDVLNQGSSYLKELVLEILEKVFRVREVADVYYSDAKMPLIGLSTRRNENGSLGLKAARVLHQLERYSKSRSMPL